MMRSIKENKVKRDMYLRYLLASFILCFPVMICETASSRVDIEVILNDCGYGSHDPFCAELKIINTEDTNLEADIYGILDVMGSFYFWPGFTPEPDFQVHTIGPGFTRIELIEFTFPDIQEVIPLGPIRLWGAYYFNVSDYGFDVADFRLDPEWKCTPTPAIRTPTPLSGDYDAGDLCYTDSILGNIRFVPATGSGGFVQGAPEDEGCSHNREYPRFNHILTRDIGVMETEVTREMWSDLQDHQSGLPEDPSNSEFSIGPKYPVQRIRWSDAVLFANLVSLQCGYRPCYFLDPDFTIVLDSDNYELGIYYCDFNAGGYRLPTEGEWEYFCRAGTTTPFSCVEPWYSEHSCGSPICNQGEFVELEKYSVFCANSPKMSVIAGMKLPNPWNLHDVHGNVWEWCWDWFGQYDSEDKIDYSGPDAPMDNTGRVRRGGYFFSSAANCRSAHRWYEEPERTLMYIGFRLVRTLNPIE